MHDTHGCLIPQSGLNLLFINQQPLPAAVASSGATSSEQIAVLASWASIEALEHKAKTCPVGLLT